MGRASASPRWRCFNTLNVPAQVRWRGEHSGKALDTLLRQQVGQGRHADNAPLQGDYRLQNSQGDWVRTLPQPMALALPCCTHAVNSANHGAVLPPPRAH